MPPIPIGDKMRLRIGFVAKKTIKKHEELFFDYGVRDSTIPWLRSDAKKIATLYSPSTSSSEPSATPLKIPLNKPHKRKRNNCPVDGCNSLQLLKLSDHLRQVHKIVDSAERKKLLQLAKKVCTL